MVGGVKYHWAEARAENGKICLEVCLEPNQPLEDYTTAVQGSICQKSSGGPSLPFPLPLSLIHISEPTRPY